MVWHSTAAVAAVILVAAAPHHAAGAPVQAATGGGGGGVVRRDAGTSGVAVAPGWACNGAQGRSGFSPDPSKYYTIGSGGSDGSLFWTQGDKDGTENNDSVGAELLFDLFGANVATQVKSVAMQNTPGAELKLSADPAQAGAHWRFVPVGNKFEVRNRLTGQLLTELGSDDTVGTGLAANRLLMTPWCAGSSSPDFGKARMTTGNRGGAVAARAIRCQPNLDTNKDGCANAEAGDTLRTSVKAIRETYRTACKMRRPSCRDGWDSYKEGALICKWRRCEKYTTMPSQESQPLWEIASVTAFVPRDQSGAKFPVQLGAEDPLIAYGSSIAAGLGAMVSAAAGSDLPGNVVKAALGVAFQGESTTEQIDAMASMMQAWTVDHVADEVARTAIDDGNAVMATVREDFAETQYPSAKLAAFAGAGAVDGGYGTPAIAEAIADQQLKAHLHSYLSWIENGALVEYNSRDTTPAAVEINKQGWSLYKTAALEALNIQRELVLLEAYDWCGNGVAAEADEHCSCESLARSADALSFVEKVAQELGNAHAMVLDDHGTAVSARESERGHLSEDWVVDTTRNGLTSRIYSDAWKYDTKDRIIHVGDGVASRNAKRDEVRNLANIEADFDMNNWSYDWGNSAAPIHAVLAGYTDVTAEMCEMIRASPAFRAEFEHSHDSLVSSV